MMVVRLECWVRFLVEGRVRLPLDKRLTFGLRGAKPRHLDSCVKSHLLKDEPIVADSQGNMQPPIIASAPSPDRASLEPSDQGTTELRVYGVLGSSRRRTTIAS